jgi:hypothetical protein
VRTARYAPICSTWNHRGMRFGQRPEVPFLGADYRPEENGRTSTGCSFHVKYAWRLGITVLVKNSRILAEFGDTVGNRGMGPTPV